MDRTEDHITQQDFAGVSESDLSLDTAHVSVCMDVPCDDQSVASPLGDVGSTEPINNAPIHVERSTLIVTDAFETQFSEETHQTLITNVSEEIISEITLEEQTQQTLIINVSEEITSEISLEEETQQTVITNVPEEIVHGISLQEETQQTLSTNVPEEIVPEISLDRKLVSSDESEEHQIADVELSKGSPRDSKELEFVKKGFNRGPDAGTDQEDEQLRQYWTRALEMSRSNVEIVEEIVKVLKHHQNTHDLMCPVCGSCVTKRVILRKRKRSSHFYVNRWYQDPLDQESEVLAKSLPSLSEQKGANENLAVEQNEPLIEAYGCLTCLSLFFQKGSDLFNLFQESAGNDCLTSLFPTYPWGITNMRPGSSVSQVIEEDLRGISGEKSFSCGLVPVLFPSYYWGSSRIAADAGGISQTPSRDDGAEAQPGKSATQTDVGRDIPSTEVHEATDRSMATAHFEVINCLPRPVIFPIYPWGSSPKSLFDQAQLGKSSTGTDVVGRDIPSTELDEATEIVQFECKLACLDEGSEMTNFVRIFSFTLFVVSCVAAASNSTGTSTSQVLNDCTSANDGQEKKVVNGWAACHNGRYVMTACQADDGSRVDIGLTVRQRGFVFECVQSSASSDTALSMRPVACLRQKNKQGPENSVVVEPGQRVRDPPFVYECVRIMSWEPNANSLSLKAVGCANSTSDIPDGGTVVLGNFTYNCSRASGSLTNTVREVFLDAKGCLYQGKEYALDERAIIGGFVFKCRSTQGWPSALEFAVIGCAYEGRRYEENEKYYTTKVNGSNRFIMQCKHSNNIWSTVPVGCIQEGNSPIEHAIGDTWIDNGGTGDPKLKYVMACRGDGNSVSVPTSQCVYQPNVNDPSTASIINGGCMKRFTKPNALVKCSKPSNPNEGVSIELIQRLNLNKFEQEALNAGFKYC